MSDKVEINYVNLINDVYYAIETLRDDPATQGINPGCDCGCGGDTFDYEAYDIECDEAIRTLEKAGIKVVG